MAGPLPFGRSGLVPQFLTAKRFGVAPRRFADLLTVLAAASPGSRRKAWARSGLGACAEGEFLSRLAGVACPLYGHVVAGRDVFLTWDGGILRLAPELRERLRIRVMQPEEFLEETSQDGRSGRRQVTLAKHACAGVILAFWAEFITTSSNQRKTSP